MNALGAGLFATGLVAGLACPASAGQISSLYTPLDLGKCELVESVPNEGGSAIWECKGYKDMRVRVAEGDLRYFVSFGAKADSQTAAGQTLTAFNTIHNTLEWRVERKDGEWVPFATILRYFWSSDGRNGETLVVTKLGSLDACHVAHVLASGNPRANDMARYAADTRARGFDCSKTQTLRFGPGGERVPQ